MYMAMKPEISVKNLLMQAFLTGWERSDKSISQDEYLQSAIQVIEVLQVEPENVYAEEGLGLTDGDEVDHLDDLLRADGQWLYYGVEEENFFLIQWYPDEASAKAKLARAGSTGRRQAVSGGPEPHARKPHRRPRTSAAPTRCSCGAEPGVSDYKGKGIFHAAFMIRNGSACTAILEQYDQHPEVQRNAGVYPARRCDHLPALQECGAWSASGSTAASIWEPMRPRWPWGPSSMISISTTGTSAALSRACAVCLRCTAFPTRGLPA